MEETLFTHIVTDIKNINAKHKDNKLNTTLQNFMYTMLRDSNAVAAKQSLGVMVELYHRNVWNDAKTVNVIATACFSKVTKEEGPKVKDLMLRHTVTHKTRKRQKKLDKALKALKKHKKKKKAEPFNFSALHLLHDPQDFAEKLFKQLESSTERFEVRLMTMDLISRLIGLHQLILFNFYPFLQRFMQPHQREVTRILLCAAQASHTQIPPDILQQMLMTVANNFITERNSNEVMTVGLNAVREICARAPLGMSEDLLRDLAQYKNYRNKNVLMAARSLIQLYRQVNPALLHKKDRGKPTEASAEAKALQYGEVDAKDYVPGAEVLPEEQPEPEGEGRVFCCQNQDTCQLAKGFLLLMGEPLAAGIDEETVSDDGWEEASCSDEDDDDSEGWVDVQHSSDEEQGEDTTAEGEKLTPEMAKRKAAAISQSRILTQEDLKLIRAKQISKEMEKAAPKGKGKKRKLIQIEDRDTGAELPSLSDIERIHKKPKSDKDTRLATVQAGREGREKFSSKKHKKNQRSSTTNKEKKKNKAFMMMKQKKQVRGKGKRSFRDKQDQSNPAVIVEPIERPAVEIKEEVEFVYIDSVVEHEEEVVSDTVEVSDKKDAEASVSQEKGRAMMAAQALVEMDSPTTAEAKPITKMEPPSPTDSGVSDMETNSHEENKARLHAMGVPFIPPCAAGPPQVAMRPDVCVEVPPVMQSVQVQTMPTQLATAAIPVTPPKAKKVKKRKEEEQGFHDDETEEAGQGEREEILQRQTDCTKRFTSQEEEASLIQELGNLSCIGRTQCHIILCFNENQTTWYHIPYCIMEHQNGTE
uniref:Protein SDA1 n=1 Tax=Branchiostoma floridae TaxID=7739 RepID=C3Y3A8_BRAFL|eukprot:XP_002609165.1 hypothetical protein BRAFLDRAFT_126677 [Branchiostoma floridae]